MTDTPGKLAFGSASEGGMMAVARNIDTESVTFISSRLVRTGMYKRRADASGADTLIIAGAFDEALFSPKGDWLLYRQGAAGAGAGGRNITGMLIGRDTAPVPVRAEPFDEEAIAPSPNGQWLAYQSDETGRTEVYVRSFPNTDSVKRKLSNGGGVAPLWSRDGTELFFLAENKQMMSARLTPTTARKFGEPVSLFRVPDELLAVEAFFYTPWDIGVDGRFIMTRLQRDAGAGAPVAVVAENWLSELRAKVR